MSENEEVFSAGKTPTPVDDDDFEVPDIPAEA